jgi:GT2 family glycosyltransferase
LVRYSEGAELTSGKQGTKTSVIVVNYNGAEHLRKCLDGLSKQTLAPSEVIVVDNHSNESPEYVTALFPFVKLIHAKKNYGYGGACNLGLKYAVSEFVAFLNNDTYPEAHWLEVMTMTIASDADIAILGCKSIQMDNNLIDSAGAIVEYPSGISYPRGYLESDVGLYSKAMELAAIGGAAFMVRKSIFRFIGGFDSRYFLYYDEVYLCWKARLAGYKVYYTPNAVVKHFGSYGLGKRSPERFRYDARNRTIAMISLLSYRSLMAYFAFEFVNAIMVVIGVLFYREYAKFGLANLKGLLQAIPRIDQAYEDRLRVQRIRKLTDGQLMKMHVHQTLYGAALRYRKTAGSKSGALYARNGYGSIDDS